MTVWENAKWYTATFKVTPVRAGVTISTGYKTGSKAHDWDWKPGEIFMLGDADGWSRNHSFGTEDRKGMILPAETAEQYLTPSEYVSLCDNKFMLDTTDVEKMGMGFRAFSKVFKYIYDNDEAFEAINDCARDIWRDDFITDKKILNTVKERNAHINNVSRKTFKNRDYEYEALRAGLARDFYVRAKFVNKKPFSTNKTELFMLIIATVIGNPVAYDEEYMAMAVEAASTFGAKTVLDMSLRGFRIDHILPMLNHDIDADLILAMD